MSKQIIRTYSAGVFYGDLEESTRSKNGKRGFMRNARRIYYWDGAATLSQLSIDGTTKPENCKFPEAVAVVELTEIIEVLQCTEKAQRSIEAVKVWKQ